MSPSDLLELAERCERASGADREFDRVIHGDVLGFCLHPHERLERTGAQSDTGFDCLDCGADSWGNKGKRGEGLHDKIPAYTSSLDAAMTLVPASERARNVTVERDDDTWGAVVWHPFDSRPDMGGAFVSPALALTAASLRARAAGLVTEDNRDG